MGHEVLLVCNADGFKKYETDILIKSHLEDYLLFKLIARLFVRIFKINIFEIEIYLRAKKIVNKLQGFDVVQLINENSFKTSPLLEIKLLKKIFKNNNKVFLLSCGVDSVSVKHAMSKKLKYSINGGKISIKNTFWYPQFYKKFKNSCLEVKLVENSCELRIDWSNK